MPFPFFWFGGVGGGPPEKTASTGGGGQARVPSLSTPSSQHPHHTRKSSLSLSASSGNSRRLAEVRSKATASYLQKELNQSGDNSRRGRASSGYGSGHGKRVGIVAIEDDDDPKHRSRIDQGLIDACNEAKISQAKDASWWSTFSVAAITPASSPPNDNNSITNASISPPSVDGAVPKHRRTISKTTFRV